MFLQRLRWYAVVIVLLQLASTGRGATIKFDQSQTGDYNLQIHLKNIELYAVFDDSGGSDDEYEDLVDYTDPTEAPLKPPPAASSLSTAAPSLSTASPSLSTASVPAYSTDATVTANSASPSLALLDPYSPSNNDKIVQMVEALIASNGNTSDLPTEPPAVAAGSQSSSTAPSPPSQSSSSASASSNTINRNKCGLGYFRDPMGRCRRIRKPHLPFLQMVHTPGVIKSFQPQQRTTDEIRTTSNNNN